MCRDKRWIFNKYDGRRYFVSCGHCPACLQEKAVKRTNRIRYNYPKDGSLVALFVTLTYRNDCIPYIRFSDFKDPCVDIFRHVPVYRDYDVRWNRCSSDYRVSRSSYRLDTPLETLDVPSELDLSGCKMLRGQDEDKIGVCYYPDVQNFIKRLRQNLIRKYNYGDNIQFFSCSEYGPTSHRPHFHLLIFCPFSRYKDVSSAIAASWSFDDYFRTRENISIARDASSYVSSYVNSSTSLPSLFKEFRSLSSSHSYSHGFGSALDVFSLPKICSAILRGDLRVSVQRMRKGTLVSDSILLPSYVLHRAFPKFKGFNRLTNDEIFDLVLGVLPFERVGYILDWDFSHYHKYRVMLQNKRDWCVSQGISLYDYALCYSRVYSVYSSNLLSKSFENVLFNHQNFYVYDNINEYFNCELSSPSLDGVLSSLRPDDVILNPNEFPANVTKHLNLSMAFNSYSKDRKVRNYIYSQNHNV